jgi:hypothetical protein
MDQTEIVARKAKSMDIGAHFTTLPCYIRISTTSKSTTTT